MPPLLAGCGSEPDQREVADPQGQERGHGLEAVGEVDEVGDRGAPGGQERKAGSVEGSRVEVVEAAAAAGVDVGGGRCGMTKMPSGSLLPSLGELEAPTKISRDLCGRSLMTRERAALFRRQGRRGTHRQKLFDSLRRIDSSLLFFLEVFLFQCFSFTLSPPSKK